MLNASPTAIDFDVYQPRNPKASAYYRCVEDHFEQLETVWDERYQGRFGFWRPYVTDVIRRYLDCGDLHFGFARVKCELGVQLVFKAELLSSEEMWKATETAVRILITGEKYSIDHQ